MSRKKKKENDWHIITQVACPCGHVYSIDEYLALFPEDEGGNCKKCGRGAAAELYYFLLQYKHNVCLQRVKERK